MPLNRDILLLPDTFFLLLLCTVFNLGSDVTQNIRYVSCISIWICMGRSS